MASLEPAVTAAAPSIAAIAMIDDGLRPMRIDLVPESERDAVLAVLGDADVLEDLAARGIDADSVSAQPDAAIEALTAPDVSHGMAYAKISDVAERTIGMIDRRQMMRQIAASIRITGDCEVMEYGPEDDLGDIARFDVVFIDYYLDDTVADGTRAEQIAAEVQGRRDATRHQQIVLMSSVEAVRAMRTQFRKSASIDGASFAFVAKKDLDEDWKVQAHLEMLARGMQHSAALGDYISTVKASAKKAAESLSTAIDDLDIGDFAYIQRIALHADGHPLGDYLSWLLSSHLTALAFEDDLRAKQAAIDAMEFEDGPLSPSEPSVMVASLYHDTLFARNLGPLTGHPRAGGSDIADVPFVQLGDVFLTTDRTRAVVILSPDCDLAFSTHGKRQPDRDLGVILLFGDPDSVTTDAAKDGDTTTEGMIDGAEVYRIDWRFNSFRTVRLGKLAEFLGEEGFDISKRDRLRPIYSLKLQHELGNHLMRVGPPVMPPIGRHAKSKIHYRQGDQVKTIDLDPAEVVLSHFKKKNTVRFTPSLVAKLKVACSYVYDDMAAILEAMPTQGQGAQKARMPMAAKVEALDGQLKGAEVWIDLLGDQPLPAPGECKRLKGSVYFAVAGIWTFPAQPAAVLVIGEDAEAVGEDARPEPDPTAGAVAASAAGSPVEAAPAMGRPAAKKGAAKVDGAPRRPAASKAAKKDKPAR